MVLDPTKVEVVVVVPEMAHLDLVVVVDTLQEMDVVVEMVLQEL